MADEREKLEGLNTKELVEKIKDGTIEAGDLDRIFYRAHRVTVEHTLRVLPGTVDYLMKQAMVLKNLSHEFYKRNSDLVNEKGLVAQLVEKVEADNPGLSYEEVLNRVERVAKSRMNDLGELKRRTKGANKGKLNLDSLDTRLGEL